MNAPAALHIATCRAWPQGNAGLQALAAQLGARLTPWQDLTPTACAHATVLPLAAWDYSQAPHAYRAWLRALQAADARVCNPPDLQDWNLDKRYLCALAAQGLPITPSLPLLPGQDWVAPIARSGWANPVIKPLIGQSGQGVRRLQAGPPSPAEFPHGALLQDFVPAPQGEACLIYLGGRYSHAAHRQPPAGEWRANSAYGVRILPLQAQPHWLASAQAALRHLPGPALYARVDGLLTADNGFVINEIELIEPALYPHLHPGGIHGFAQALRAALAA